MTARTKKWLVWGVSMALGAVLLMVAGPLSPYRKTDNWICRVTGSTKSEITWFGYFKHDNRTFSALEQWLKEREPTFEPEWQLSSTQEYYLGGRTCGLAGRPEIYSLRPLLDRSLAKLAEKRIVELVAVLRHGSFDEQMEMIQSISDELITTQ